MQKSAGGNKVDFFFNIYDISLFGLLLFILNSNVLWCSLSIAYNILGLQLGITSECSVDTIKRR